MGTITLVKDEDAADKIDLYEWCGSIVNSKNTAVNQLATERAHLRKKNEQVKRLEQTLAELERLKIDNENQLLEKFALLLNEKKLKIRDQQRLLASSNVDPARLAAVKASRNGRAHSAGPSRDGKRKAGSKVESDEESNGFEDMEVDEDPNDSEQDRPQTPEDESTADEASEDEGPPIKPPGPRESSAEASSSKAPPPKAPAPVPPKRELPFQKKAAPKPAPVVDGSETESDDEL